MEGKCIMVLWDDSSKKNMVNTDDFYLDMEQMDWRVAT